MLLLQRSTYSTNVAQTDEFTLHTEYSWLSHSHSCYTFAALGVTKHTIK